MRVFLTGATGYVGSAILDTLLRGGHQVTALIRDPEKADLVAARGVQTVLGELANPAGFHMRLSQSFREGRDTDARFHEPEAGRQRE